MKPKNRYYKNWSDELDAHTVYGALVAREQGNTKGFLFEQLKNESLHQAEIWKEKAGEEGKSWVYQPSARVKLISSLIGTFGPGLFIDALSAMKIRGMSVYRSGSQHPVVKDTESEKIHSKMKAGSNLRAAVFGVSDGLVSNASLVFAMVGGKADNHTIVLAGVAGLLAGGLSMATGEYISVKSQTELFENQIGLERDELEAFPEEEAKELSLIYQAKGIDKETADKISFTLVQDKEKALDTLAREELGLNPSELGSPVGAAISSFFSFTVGAFLPILPFLILTEGAKFSLILSLSSLFAIGLMISFLTGKSALVSAFRMTLLGFLSGAVTYYIGSLIGVAV